MNWRYLLTVPVIVLISLDPTFGGHCAALFDRGKSTVEVTLVSNGSDPALSPDRRLSGKLRTDGRNGEFLALDVDVGRDHPIEFFFNFDYNSPYVYISLYSFARERLERHFSGSIKLTQLDMQSEHMEIMAQNAGIRIGRRPLSTYATFSNESVVVWLCCGFDRASSRYIALPALVFSNPGVKPVWVSSGSDASIVVQSSQNELFFFRVFDPDYRENLPHRLVGMSSVHTPPDFYLVGSRGEPVKEQSAGVIQPFEMELIQSESNRPNRREIGRIKLKSDDFSRKFDRMTLRYRGEVGGDSFRVLSVEFSNSQDGSKVAVNVPRALSQVRVSGGYAVLRFYITDRSVGIFKLNPSPHITPSKGLGFSIRWKHRGFDRDGEEVSPRTSPDRVPVFSGT